MKFDTYSVTDQIETELTLWQAKIDDLHRQHNVDLELLQKEVTARAWRKVTIAHKLIQVKSSLRKLEPFGGVTN